jgi:hypothetical protein
MDEGDPQPVPASQIGSGPIRVVADAELRGHGELGVRQTRFERRYVHNSQARGGQAVGVELIDCATWSCVLFDVHLEDCVVRNLKTAPGGGGRTTPLFFWGGSARRVTLAGTNRRRHLEPPETRQLRSRIGHGQSGRGPPLLRLDRRLGPRCFRGPLQVDAILPLRSAGPACPPRS